MARTSTTQTAAAIAARLLCVLGLVASLLTPIFVTTASGASTAWIDTFDRQGVIDAHSAAFGAEVPDHGWSGDLSSCTAGITNAVYRSASIDRVNWFRSMAGLGPVAEDADRSADAQQAAVMNAAQNAISHDANQTASYTCHTATAGEAAANSNLFLGRTGPAAINGYVRDFGPGNVSVGHRSWILSPTAQRFGVGDVPHGVSEHATNVLWVIEPTWSSAPAARRDDFIAWPNQGFVPSSVVYDRWSFALPRETPAGVDFDEATVVMQRLENGQPVETIAAPIVYRDRNPGAPVDIVVWEPALDFGGNDSTLSSPLVDTTYRITIGNLTAESGATISYRYDVTVMGAETAIVPPAAAIRHETAAESGGFDPNDAFANAAFTDFLGRDATPAELIEWSNQLADGVERHTLVMELTRQDEWVATIVDRMYQDTLGRPGDAAGTAFWIDQVNDGMTVATMAARFYGSPEYIDNEGGAIDRWLEDLYLELMGRPADAAGLSFWMEQTEETGTIRVAQRFYQSDESARARVQALYVDLLDRGTDGGGETFWAARLQETGDDLTLAGQLAASDEYFAKAADRN